MLLKWIVALLVGLAGILLVIVLIATGKDPHHAAAFGPPWKRRLITAALVLLAWCGLAPSGAAQESRALPPSLAGPAARQELRNSAAWQRITATWNEAAAIASGGKGSYPFDEAGKKRILSNLSKAQDDVRGLCAQGMLSETEAALLIKDIQMLTSKVSSYRITGMEMATCYKPVMVQPARDALQRLTDRLPLLEKLASSGRVHHEVLDKIASTIERDLKTLDKDVGGLDANKVVEARKTCQRVRHSLDLLRKQAAPKGV